MMMENLRLHPGSNASNQIPVTGIRNRSTWNFQSLNFEDQGKGCCHLTMQMNLYEANRSRTSLLQLGATNGAV